MVVRDLAASERASERDTETEWTVQATQLNQCFFVERERGKEGVGVEEYERPTSSFRVLYCGGFSFFCLL